MGYVYVTSERAGRGGAENDLFTVGHYDPDGKWHPESDHATPGEAGDRVAQLNGGHSARTEADARRYRAIRDKLVARESIELMTLPGNLLSLGGMASPTPGDVDRAIDAMILRTR